MKKLMFALSAIFAALSLSSCSSDKEDEVIDRSNYESVVLRNQMIPSSILGEDRRYSIYLPADYAESGKTYPILYLLHGSDGDNNIWFDDGKAQTYADAQIRSDKAPAMIIVSFAADNSFYTNYASGNGITSLPMEDFFFNEFIPYIESTYPVKKSRKSRAIGGYSMGGYGAIYYGLQRPDMFCLAYSMSGVFTFDNDEAISNGYQTVTIPEVFDRYSTGNYGNLPRLVIACGTEDDFYPENEYFVEYMQNRGFYNYEWKPGEGYNHQWSFWSLCLEDLYTTLNSVF